MTGLALQGRRARVAWLAAFVVAAVVLFVAYLGQSTRATYVNSDGATNALQAWDMLHGNLLLHGWALADVSFYTTDMPQYMLVEAIRGLGPEAVHVSAAITYTVLVLLAGWLAKGRASGAEGVARVLIAAGIMLAPQLGGVTGILLLSPDHVGTCVPLLLAWLAIDRADGSGWLGRNRWLVPVIVGVLLTWTAIGDPLAEVIGALPLGLVCGMRAVQSMVPRREPLQKNWYQLSLAAAAVVCVPAAWAVTRLIAAHGGWTATAARTGLASSGMLGRNAALTGHGILQLFGADFTAQPRLYLAIFAGLHLIGLGLAAWALWLAAWRFFAAELLVQVLAAGIVINLAAYLFTTQAQDITRTREIAAVLPFGAVLAGRLVAGRLLAARLGWARLAPAMAAVFAVYAGMLVSNAVQPSIPAPPSNLASWLSAHGLSRGLAGYWQASSVTLYSRGSVEVRAVITNGGKLAGQAHWDAKKAWYDPATNYADFLVSVGRAGRWQQQSTLREMAAVAGRPVKVYQAGPYTVAVWPRNLLSLLR